MHIVVTIGPRDDQLTLTTDGRFDGTIPAVCLGEQIKIWEEHEDTYSIEVGNDALFDAEQACRTPDIEICEAPQNECIGCPIENGCEMIHNPKDTK